MKINKNFNLGDFFSSLKEESDRGLVLLTATFLDNILFDLFEYYLILDNIDLKKSILESSLSPLNSFSNKIKMSYCLGLIDKKQFNNLKFIKEVRNIFAHSLDDVNFNNKKIIELCKKIDIPRIPGYNQDNIREIFYDASFFLAGYLKARISSLKKCNFS
jgi:DNA-binding MltR family transcriptional regulator